MLILLNVFIALLSIIQMNEHICKVVFKIGSLFLAHLILLFYLHSLSLRLCHLGSGHLISLTLSLSLHWVMLLSCILASISKSCLHHLWLHLAPIMLLLLLLHHLLVLCLVLLLMSIGLFHVIHVLLMSFKHINVYLKVIPIVLILIHPLIQVVFFLLIAFLLVFFFILILLYCIPILLLLLLVCIGFFRLWIWLLTRWVWCLCTLLMLWGLRVRPLLINRPMHSLPILNAERWCNLYYSCIIFIDLVLFELRGLCRCRCISVLVHCLIIVLLLLLSVLLLLRVSYRVTMIHL
jgi:hypothetical protein